MKPTDASKLQYGDIAGKIIGAAFEVHRSLGNGSPEVIYRRALSYEMRRAGLAFENESSQGIFYRNLPRPISTRRADFVAEGTALVELKVVGILEHVHWAQVLDYLRAYEPEVGLLLSPGSTSMTFGRFVL